MATSTKQALQGSEAGWIMRPTTAEAHSQGRLLGGPSAPRALLQFLASTNVALLRAHL